ncbi:septal ring factor EnvC (AmiA/AmiB activator) [Vulcaniibacterium tengchongense]|uniref:Septal ring factor EnvC (AmiA/AmiB activator) n=1 Tax=Vulcaniibacterium tengchongense TaxID=1273429 RepID=A0A3N4V0K8_9GAMM|nr:peptidoglycan DD-metalloendopeptidase family protein [Vulcaniibacterium tengchongense]RPE75968.1 septal ring factor EnvC (AmiA/AmiB activator) [Vulcaniibacterium tengchongense]
MRRALALPIATVLVVLSFGPPSPAAAQNSREAERKLEKIRSELKAVASERRKLESQRGSAAKELREADEQVGATGRRLRELETRLAREQAALGELQRQRSALQDALAGQRRALAELLRAADRQGQDAPLKLLLAQDSVADAGRTLAYYGYLQRDRARRIAAMNAQLRELEEVEQAIARRRRELDDTRARQREQLAQLERERRERAALVAQLEQRYRDRASRERQLGRDAKGLEQLLKKLRAAAARAEAQRRAAAERAAREQARGAPKRKPAQVASAPAPQVGGLGWPVSGALLAGYGATMPDGRSSDGLLIAAAAGAPVKAVADGTVVYAEWMTGYGLLAIVDHGNGYMSLYAHNDALLKDVGATVKRGDTLATVGNSGGQGRPALYFELRRNGAPVNPATWLRR